MERLRIFMAGMLILLATSLASASEFLLMPITLDTGLSQSSVHCVLRDTKGYLWIGTDYGLNRYDNSTVTNYFANGAPGSIPDNFVEFLCLDSNGDLLIGFSHGLARYDYTTDTFLPITFKDKEVIARCARTTDHGTLIGGMGKLYLYNSYNRQLNEMPTSGGSATAYTSILPQWQRGQYILQTRWDGLWLYDNRKSTIRRLSFCAEKNIRAATVDSRGNLWAAPFGQGIQKYDHSGNLIQEISTGNSQLSSDIVLDMIEYEHYMCIGTERGLDIIDTRTMRVSNLNNLTNGLKNNTILCLSKDQGCGLFAGTLRHGVLCLYEVPMRTFTQWNNVMSHFGFTVTSLLPDPETGNVWVGVDGEGVAIFDPVTESFKPYSSTDGLKVTSIVRYDPDHLLLAIYNKELRLLNIHTGALSQVPPSFKRVTDLAANKTSSTELFALDDGRIVTVNDVICIVDPKGNKADLATFTAIRGVPEKLNPLYNDGKKLLLHDKHHIYRYDSAVDTCGVIMRCKDVMKCAAYDGKSALWIATAKGLEKHDLANKTTKTIKTDHIHNINSLALEDDRVWIGADNRLYLLNGETVTVFDSADGVAPNQFINKAQLLTEDCLLLGGVNGMLKIDRQDIDHLIEQPSNTILSLSEVLVDNKRMALGDDNTIDVPNDHSSITIKVIDHDNSGRRNKLFRYTIDGFNRDFKVETFDRALSLSMMPPGHYQVYAAYNLGDGKWSAPTLLVTLDVHAPLWLSWWAITIYAIILFGIIAGLLIYFHIRRQKKIDKIKNEALEDKIAFLTRLHSELRTPLALVMSPLNSLLERLRHSGQHDTANELEDIYHSSLQMRDIIDTLPESKDLVTHMEQAEEKKTAPKSKVNDTEEKNVVDDFDVTPYSALVVEENEKLCAYIVSQLQAMFREVMQAHDAAEAKVIIKNSHPDIVIADVALKGENGFELCREIKKSEAYRHIPVMLLTSGNAESEKHKSYIHGADSYLSKPFDVDVLVSRCKNLLMNRSIMRRRYDKKTLADTVGDKALTNSDESFIIELNRLLTENISHQDFGVEFLAKKMAMGRTSFYARVRQITGKSIGQYISDFRLSQAKNMLANEALSISEIAEHLGFRSQRYFSTLFKERTGVTPTDYRTSALAKKS